jgi:hypothetical protein
VHKPDSFVTTPLKLSPHFGVKTAREPPQKPDPNPNGDEFRDILVENYANLQEFQQKC